ncbi:MAG: hypothetical protein Q9159_003239 [Coniocarpon cinnabarinum]
MFQSAKPSICLSCRLKLLSRLVLPPNPRKDIRRTVVSHTNDPWKFRKARRSQVRRAGQVRKAHTETDQDLNEQSNEQFDVRSTLDPEAVARHARKRFGDRLPEGALREEEYRVYERMFGAPLIWEPRHEEESVVEDGFEDADGAVDERDVLLKEGADGKLEEVTIIEDEGLDLDQEQEDGVAQSDPDALVERDIQAALASASSQGIGNDRMEPEDLEPDAVGETQRAHPYTLAARVGTNPTTIELPKNSFVGPASVLLADTKNRHLDEAAEKTLGGPGLPYGVGTPRVSRTMPQKPTPMDAYQHRMSSIEADVYLSSLMPGYYASLMGVLVEIRRRLGPEWIRDLLYKSQHEGGPSVLDAGAGGAGALAWRDLFRAEIQQMSEAGTIAVNTQDNLAALDGKTTVLTGSDALRHRASVLLHNTSFLPRLPDYFHLSPNSSVQSTSNSNEDGTSQPQARKQFDIILAPHSLWTLEEDWQRREHIQNLWAMLNPDGGVLVLLEKGVPRGFEVIASARQYILDCLFTNAEKDKRAGVDEGEAAADGRSRHAAPGSILAPCTTHARCPLYRFSGISKQRKDYCHFSQRYLRPPFLQRLLGAKNRNHEDVKYSYVAVMKGKSPEEVGRTVTYDDEGKKQVRERLMGQEATDRAFEGYDVHDSDLSMSEPTSSRTDIQAQPIDQQSVPATIDSAPLPSPASTTSSDGTSHLSSAPHPSPHPLALPHLILPPLKRPGHIMLDVCTPSGTFERWTVPRSMGKTAYRDARKSVWGDGWALGAKTREFRKVRVGRGMGTVMGHVDEKVSVEAGNGKDDARTGRVRGKEQGYTGRLKARRRKREERRAEKERALEDEVGAEEA